MSAWHRNNDDTPTRAEANRDEADTLPAHLTAEEQAQVTAAFWGYGRLLSGLGRTS